MEKCIQIAMSWGYRRHYVIQRFNELITKRNIVTQSQILQAFQEGEFAKLETPMDLTQSQIIRLEGALGIHKPVRRESMESPIGLSNACQNCFFNSLVQTLFRLPEFVELVLSLETDWTKIEPFAKRLETYLRNREVRTISMTLGSTNPKEAAIVVKNLAEVFVLMAGSDISFVNITPQLAEILKQFGLELGHQHDINEIFAKLMDSVEILSILSSQNMEKLESEITENSEVSVIDEEAKTTLKPLAIDLKSEIDGIFTTKVTIRLRTYSNEKGAMATTEKKHVFPHIDMFIRAGVSFEELLHEAFVYISDPVEDKETALTGVFTKQKVLIDELPNALLVSFNRMRFNKATNRIEKLSDEFQFPLQVSLEKYTQENYKKNRAKLKQFDELNQKYLALKRLSSHLKSITSVSDLTSEDFEKILESLNYTEVMKQRGSDKFYKLSTDEAVQEIDKKVSELRGSSHLPSTSFSLKVKELKNEVISCLRSLAGQINQIEDEFSEKPYVLYSITVHEGSDGAGHYYIYAKELNKTQTSEEFVKSEKWLKMNDTSIKPADQIEVFRKAYALEHPKIAAYNAMYVRRDVLDSYLKKAKSANSNLMIKIGEKSPWLGFLLKENQKNSPVAQKGPEASEKMKEVLSRNTRALEQIQKFICNYDVRSYNLPQPLSFQVCLASQGLDIDIMVLKFDLFSKHCKEVMGAGFNLEHISDSSLKSQLMDASFCSKNNIPALSEVGKIQKEKSSLAQNYRDYVSCYLIFDQVLSFILKRDYESSLVLMNLLFNALFHKLKNDYQDFRNVFRLFAEGFLLLILQEVSSSSTLTLGLVTSLATKVIPPSSPLQRFVISKLTETSNSVLPKNTLLGCLAKNSDKEIGFVFKMERSLRVEVDSQSFVDGFFKKNNIFEFSMSLMPFAVYGDSKGELDRKAMLFSRVTSVKKQWSENKAQILTLSSLGVL